MSKTTHTHALVLNRNTCCEVTSLEPRLLFTMTTPTELTVLLRGQSNANLFGGDYQYYDFQGACAQANALLGFPDKDPSGNHYVRAVESSTSTNNTNTINSGTAFIGDWVASDGNGGWTDQSLETGLLNNITSQPASIRTAPAAVVWLHNEYDSSSTSLTTAEWTSAVRFDATQVRSAFGQSAATVPYLFVNAIPYSNGRDAANQAIKVGMQQLSDDPTFNAKIASQFSDVNMDYYQTGTYGGPHMDSADGATLESRLAYSIADTFAQYALPGSPIALANGHFDQLGPQVVQAQTVMGNANQLNLTVSMDGATALNSTLSTGAAAGVGWSLVTTAGVKTGATAATVVDATHIRVTFPSAVPTDGSVTLNYAYGVGRIGANSTQAGEGNAIYDNFSGTDNTQGFPVWTIATGVPINGAAQQPETARVNGTSGVVAGTTPTVATAPTATPSPVTGTTTTLNVLGADTGPGGEAGLTYTWSTTSTPGGAPAVTFSSNGANASKSSVATFHDAGAYTFQVLISNGSHSTTTTVGVTVNQTQTTLAITPSSVTLATGATQQFAVAWKDQFGNTISSPTVTWSVSSGSGSISTSGLYTAPAAAGSATVKAVTGSSSATASVTITASSGALPTGWTDTDINSPPVAGSATYNGSAYTVSGSGDNITGYSDQFNYASTSVTGNQTLIARVTSLTNPNAGATAGVMFRDSTAVNSADAVVDVTPSGVISFITRASSSGVASTTNATVSTGITVSSTTPVWLKLVKNGTGYTAFYGTGTATPTTWTAVGTSATVTFVNSTFLAGLSVNSFTTSALATAIFDNVSA